MIGHYVLMDVKSGNVFTNQRGRGSWYTYKGYRDSWYKYLRIYFLPRRMKEKRIARCRITRIMPHRHRKFDDANFRHGCKPIPDFLKMNGWIVDDSPKWFECEYRQIRLQDSNKRESGTLVEIEY